MLNSNRYNLPPGTEEYKENIPVSVKEQKRLAELETVITKNFKAFYEVGCALREIREKRYYREEYDSFEDYCRDMWDMMERSANYHIKAAKVVDNLQQTLLDNPNPGTIVPGINLLKDENKHLPLPQNEQQARVLSRLSPEDQPKVWIEAVKTVPEKGKITASHIKKTIRLLNLESIAGIVKDVAETDIDKKTDEESIKESRINKEFRAAFETFFEQVQEQRKQNWRYTEKKIVLRFLEALHSTVKSEI